MMPCAWFSTWQPIALDRARGAAVFLDGEDAGQERAGDAAHRVDAEGVERVVIAEGVLQAGGAPVADDARRERR